VPAGGDRDRLRRRSEHQARGRLYIALTRPLDLVRIVVDQVTIGQDPVLRELVGA